MGELIPRLRGRPFNNQGGDWVFPCQLTGVGFELGFAKANPMLTTAKNCEILDGEMVYSVGQM